MIGRRPSPRRTALVLALLLLACDRPIAPSSAPLDWASLADRQMILVATTDPDGAPRVTRLWIVVVDGSGYLRSADTPWSRDVARDPRLLLIVDDISHRVSAVPVPFGTEEHARVMRAYDAKYGLLGRSVLRVYGWMGRYAGPEDARILRLSAEEPTAQARRGTFARLRP